jgi:AIPR protein
MNDEEFRHDLLTAAAARAETASCGAREAFVAEMLDRLREAGELPDAEPCSEALVGQRGRKLEIDAYAFDEADSSLNLFVALRDGGLSMPQVLTLTEARDQGFGRLLGIYEQAHSGWLAANIEESRPLWGLARRIQQGPTPAALRLHILSDRCLSERVREIPGDATAEGTSITFQIWDLTRLKRIHEARNARDDLVVDFNELPHGGLPVLPAAVGNAGYEAYLAVIPADALADIYLRYGSRLLEGNVRTFLGRRGSVNKGIANTLAKVPERFFAYNNGIAATAASVVVGKRSDGLLMITSASDLQIVNGAQTTASLAAVRREKKTSLAGVFVPMKLSVVAAEVAGQIIPLISRYSNSQNAVRASDFFANHEFHRRMEEISRRVLAPAVGNSQVPTHWYYERARGQHLNDQAGLSSARRESFLRVNPKQQVITKTDLAKVECCFERLPDIACKGAEKSFVDFAERMTKQWEEEARRATFGDDWFRSAVARVILFRACERLVSNAPWYEGGYRAQIVAYGCARLTALASEESDGGHLDYLRIWATQSAGDVLERQILAIAEIMADVLRTPPQAGQNVSEWAKQQACRKRALEIEVPVERDFSASLLDAGDARIGKKDARVTGRIDQSINAITRVVNKGPKFWSEVKHYAREMSILTPEDEKAFFPALSGRIPTDRQAGRLIGVLDRCEQAGWEGAG